MTNDTQLKLGEFWKNHFTILNCLTLIDNAWTQITYRTMNPACKNLWRDSVAERDNEGLEHDDSALNDEIMNHRKKYGTQSGKRRC